MWWQVPDAEALYTGELYTNPNDFSSKVTFIDVRRNDIADYFVIMTAFGWHTNSQIGDIKPRLGPHDYLKAYGIFTVMVRVWTFQYC